MMLMMLSSETFTHLNITKTKRIAITVYTKTRAYLPLTAISTHSLFSCRRATVWNFLHLRVTFA